MAVIASRQLIPAMEALLHQPVLVLNRLWQAVNICSARRALTMLFEGNAQVVHSEDGDFNTFGFHQWADFSEDEPDPESIHGVSIKLRLPRVILLMVYDRMPRKEVKFTRHNIFQRDKNTCQYCGKTLERRDLNLDHVVPRDRGGPTTWENIVCSCIPCNTQKGNRTPKEAKLRLIKLPRKPKWRPFIQVSFGVKAHDCWKHFIDVAYWNVELGEEKR